MKRIYKTINYVESSQILWGNLFSVDGEDVVLCITGNPGISAFYIDFASAIHKHTCLPVCVINHAGHEQVPHSMPIQLKNHKHLFNLDGQLKQKLEFINKYISKESKIHLVGHSIGAWMIVELLDKNDELFKRIASVNLLFPTLQKMAQSKNGWYMNNIIRKIYKILLFLCTLLQFLPEFICKFLINSYLSFNTLSLAYYESIYQLINPYVLEKILFLAFDEMDTVNKLNICGIEKMKHFTNVIYGTNDDWAPLAFMEDLVTFQPELQLKEVDISHAFVLKSSKKVANMVSEFINQKKFATNKNVAISLS